ncbi:MAG: hypothetical protein OXU20_18950 [Myxococcales bacterium]|nr:hypothetical protein [Myxococcales bacterium]MDD9967784.1 hypothetical protein [Myxococcales bacterium]
MNDTGFRGLALLLLGLLVAAACSTLGLRETFVASGDVIELTSAEAERPAGEPQEKGQAERVRLFLRSAPDGFELISGEPAVQVGYGHRIVGRVDLHLGRGACDPGQAHNLAREAVLRKLRDRARVEGGDAVIFIDTRAEDVWMSDCDRLDQVGPEVAHHGPWASGWVVRLEQARSAPARSADAGPGMVSDAGVLHPFSDGGLPTALDAGVDASEVSK